MLEQIRSHMPSWLAFVDTSSNTSITYKELVKRVDQVCEQLRSLSPRTLVFLTCSPTPDPVIIYLACLKLDYPICLIEPDKPNLHETLLSLYEPGIVCLPKQYDVMDTEQYEQTDTVATSYKTYTPKQTPQNDIHPSLGVLLPTSGSTGNPKLVRLQAKSVAANAVSIAEYLKLTQSERSIQSLPMHYAYGLSLINSHLVAGASTIFTPHSFMRPEFWNDFNTYGCTSFAGVPYMYETLDRLRFDPKRYPSLRYMTQAGGGLRNDLIEKFYGKLDEVNAKFVVMYGQTEATARISYLPPSALPEKTGSIGVSIPGGIITLRDVEGAEEKELVYEGPNVMMGYAENKDSLSKGDEMEGTLFTGDLAKQDEEGYFYIVGRLKRFGKLFGKRINLVDIETMVETQTNLRVAALDDKSQLVLFIEAESADDELHRSIRNDVAKKLKVTPKAIRVDSIEKIPMTTSGKKDYAGLKKFL